MAIEHRVDRTLGGDRSPGKTAQQALARFPRTPTGRVAVDVQNEVLYWKGKLVGVAIRAAAAVGEPLNAAFLITIEDLVTGLTGNPKLSAQFRHRLARQPASHKLHSFIHDRTLLPRHHSLP